MYLARDGRGGSMVLLVVVSFGNSDFDESSARDRLTGEDAHRITASVMSVPPGRVVKEQTLRCISLRGALRSGRLAAGIRTLDWIPVDS